MKQGRQRAYRSFFCASARSSKIYLYYRNLLTINNLNRVVNDTN